MDETSSVQELPSPVEESSDQKSKESGFPWSSTIALGVTGLAVGALVGLSVSPVVGVVVSAVVGSAAAIVAAVSGVKKPEGIALNAWPLAAFAALLVVGALGGLKARTSEIFSANPYEAEISRWEVIGIEPDMVARRLFLRSYPPSAGEFPLNGFDVTEELDQWAKVGITNTAVVGQHLVGVSLAQAENGQVTSAIESKGILDGVLLGGTSSECEALYQEWQINGNDWQAAFAYASVERWRALSIITDTETLKDIYEKDLCGTR